MYNIGRLLLTLLETGIRSAKFTQSELAQHVLDVPPEVLAPQGFFGRAGQVKETSMGFIHDSGSFAGEICQALAMPSGLQAAFGTFGGRK
jgi:hypothetical protein